MSDNISDEKEQKKDDREQMLERRVIFCDEMILPKTAETLWINLFRLTEDKDIRPITFYINSPGGMLADGLAMGGMVEASPAPIHTIGVARVCSAALFPFAAGAIRRAYPHTTFTVHDFSAQLEGKQSELRSAMEYFERLKDEILEFLSRKTKPDKEWWAKKILTERQQDYYFNPEEALEIGLIDEIIRPFKK